MKEKEAFPGKYYVVTSPNGCTVTAKNGKQLGTVEAGKQGGFTAIDSAIEASDDEAEITQLFKLAPQQRLALLGVLGGGVPAWKLKYAKCVTVEDMLAVNPDAANDVTSDGFWGFPLPKFNDKIYDVLKDTKGIKHLELYLPEQTGTIKSSSKYKIAGLQTLSVYAPKFRGDWATFWWEPNLKKAHLYMPAATVLSEYVSGSKRLTEVTGDFSSLSEALAFAESCNALVQCKVRFPKLSSGGRMFGDCKLDKESTLCILNSIPAYTSGNHPLTIGIHIDHQNDEEVLAAIANAEAKGWTLTVQWNGTPTAQASVTYGLRKPTIYARVSEHDGKRFLDWGHYVTDPSGYEEFRSVEAAREYFGLPKETLTETE